MWPNPQFPAALIIFTEEILNGKLHFLRSEKFLARWYLLELFFMKIANALHTFFNDCRYKLCFGIDVNKTSESKELNICHYWYFSTKCLKGCYDLLIMSLNLRDIDILSIKGTDYCCIISGISKNDAIT